jgi:transcription elongation factor Elf1
MRPTEQGTYNLTPVPATSKAYEKQLVRHAKEWDTTYELSTTFNCAHCKKWTQQEKSSTNVKTPPTGIDLNYNGHCSVLKQNTQGMQVCDLFMANHLIKIPEKSKRPENAWGPKDNR